MDVHDDQESTPTVKSLEQRYTEVYRMSQMPAKNRANNLNQVIKYEMITFEQSGKKSENLENIYQAMCAIPPTSVESEHAFSAVGFFCDKIEIKIGR